MLSDFERKSSSRRTHSPRRWARRHHRRCGQFQTARAPSSYTPGRTEAAKRSLRPSPRPCDRRGEDAPDSVSTASASRSTSPRRFWSAWLARSKTIARQNLSRGFFRERTLPRFARKHRRAITGWSAHWPQVASRIRPAKSTRDSTAAWRFSSVPNPRRGPGIASSPSGDQVSKCGP